MINLNHRFGIGDATTQIDLPADDLTTTQFHLPLTNQDQGTISASKLATANRNVPSSIKNYYLNTRVLKLFETPPQSLPKFSNWFQMLNKKELKQILSYYHSASKYDKRLYLYLAFSYEILGNKTKAFDALLKGVKAYDCGCINYLAASHSQNPWLKKHPEQVVKLYKRGIELGNTNSAYQLGCFYLAGGIGGTPDYVNAIKWLEHASQLGCAPASYKLAHLFLNGCGTVQANEEKALKWYSEAANSHYLPAQLELANLLMNKGQEQEAFKLTKNAIQDSELLNNLPPDIARLRTESLYKLAQMYENGIGTQKNQDEAKYYHSLVANSKYFSELNIVNKAQYKELHSNYIDEIASKAAEILDKML